MDTLALLTRGQFNLSVIARGAILASARFWRIMEDSMSILQQSDASVWSAIQQEQVRQRDGLELIASENYTSAAVMEAAGTVLTNKYAEGYPGRRYYGGCETAVRSCRR